MNNLAEYDKNSERKHMNIEIAKVVDSILRPDWRNYLAKKTTETLEDDEPGTV